MSHTIVVPNAEAPSPGGSRRVNVGGREIALYNVDGAYYATDDVCTHDEASLADGELFGCIVECPLHGARFDVRNGKALSLPAVYPVRTYPTRISDAGVEVTV
ncbi:MAG: non-heme iron oxygenase ferredoxin subunit [Chloroflexi bacterium]|nr:non-heme iron oxygenase ferredoxin subunit [Chloroflexota bacterium]